MARTLPLLVLAALLLSGCSADVDTGLDVEDTLGSGVRILGANGALAANGTALTWDGAQVSADGPYDRDRFEFALEVPAEFWTENAGTVQIGAMWEFANYYRGDPRQGVLLDITLFDADGNVVASTGSGDSPLPGTTASVRTSTLLVVPELAPGAYRVDVTARSGHTSYDGFVLVDARPRDAPATELLPNLVTLTPINVAIDHPRYLGMVKADGGAVGAPGCSLNEVVLEGQENGKCLRFGNLVGNAGPGPFLLWVSDEEVQGGFVGLSDLMQRIPSTDGTFRDEPAGKSDYDVQHRHRHVQGITHFTLYAYDWEAKERGPMATEVRKNGWNPAHTGLIGIQPAARISSACQGGPDGADCLGLTAGWYDLYSPDLPEQFLDVSDVPDGVYELHTEVNVDRVIEESDYSDNESSLVIRIRGDEVDVLGVPPPA